MSEDFAVKARVVEALDFEPGLDAMDIGVSVRNGLVTLSGHVDSHAEKYAAELAAQRIDGVNEIAQDIVVRQSGDSKRGRSR